jgi:hypothetical protein
MKLIDNTYRQDIGADEVTDRDLVDDSGSLLIKVRTANSQTRCGG